MFKNGNGIKRKGRKMEKRKKILCFLFAIAVLGFFPEMLPAKIETGKEVKVKILYDFSGSMYPGYPETPRHQSGVKFFHRYDTFKAWFANFVSSQTRFGAKNVSLSVFRSMDRFRPGDIRETHSPVPVRKFNVNRAFSQEKPHGVDYTYLAESLDYFTGNNFEGIVWLVTDNRVETGESRQTTKDFFIHLRDTPRYRSVHIYKLPFDDREKNQHSDLAVYGILVSPLEVSNEAAQWYDERFFEFKDIFRESRHLKLKDLSINPFRIDIEPIVVDIDSYQKGFSEGKIIKIPMKGKIKSNLTQHTITGGTLKIKMIEDFIPDAKAQKKYGVEKIAGTLFREVEVNLAQEIPPNGTAELKKFHISSKQKVPLSVSGLGNLIRAAASGLKVKYTGKGIVSSNRINVALKQEGRLRISGIYSSGEMGPVFGAQSAITKIQAKPAKFGISFILKSGGLRSVILLLILLALLVPLVFLGIFLARKEKYRIRHEQKEEIIELMRLGSHSTRCESHFLGTLKRGVGNVDSFTPNTARAGLKVTPGKQKGEFEVSINIKNEQKAFKLTIEPFNKTRTIVTAAASSPHSRSCAGPMAGKKIKHPGSPTATSGTSKSKIKIRRP